MNIFWLTMTLLGWSFLWDWTNINCYLSKRIHWTCLLMSRQINSVHFYCLLRLFTYSFSKCLAEVSMINIAKVSQWNVRHTHSYFVFLIYEEFSVISVLSVLWTLNNFSDISVFPAYERVFVDSNRSRSIFRRRMSKHISAFMLTYVR